jgi:hypothetical protein
MIIRPPTPHMPTSKDILLSEEAIVHGSTTTKATLHNDHYVNNVKDD